MSEARVGLFGHQLLRFISGRRYIVLLSEPKRAYLRLWR
jgi:hypothetical protein